MGKNTAKIFLILLFTFTSALLFSDETKIRYFQIDERSAYQIKLLNLVIEKTRIEYGDAAAVPVNTKMTVERGLQLLEKGKSVDIAFMPVNAEREQTFQGIRFPIMQGLLGYRVLLTRKETDFQSIDSLSELQKLKRAGLVKKSGNAEIFTHNNLAFDDSAVVDELLYKKLKTGKIDYIPVEIFTAWDDLEKTQKKYPDFQIDSKNGFYYPYPVYYFVNKDNTSLAERIEKGLNAAYTDGSMREMFLMFFSEIIEKAAPDKRNYFELENPSLPPYAAIAETAWWFNSKLQSH